MEHVTASDIAVNLIIFVLATLLGVELIRHVPRLLHTPLMSLTNAISAVSVVAGLIVLSRTGEATGKVLIITLATIAVALAGSNAIGGFMITERILRMFRSRQRAKP
jgi:NAD(P) transhydrogenase subunit alpha